jgi:flagellar hook protein FlgE
MTISSSLNAGVAGLNANANRLATISDNIANSSTFGYKRAQSDFHSVVIHGNARASYSAGGVRVSNMRLIDDRGPLIATSNPTDLAIDGRGFIPVTTIGAVNGMDEAYPISLATTGSCGPKPAMSLWGGPPIPTARWALTRAIRWPRCSRCGSTPTSISATRLRKCGWG